MKLDDIVNSLSVTNCNSDIILAGLRDQSVRIERTSEDAQFRHQVARMRCNTVKRVVHSDVGWIVCCEAWCEVGS
jgi:hypothetical protein